MTLSKGTWWLHAKLESGVLVQGDESEQDPPCRGHQHSWAPIVCLHECRNKPPRKATGTNRNLCQNTARNIDREYRARIINEHVMEARIYTLLTRDRLYPLFLPNPATLPFCHGRLDQSRPVCNNASDLFYECLQIDFWVIYYTVLSVQKLLSNNYLGSLFLAVREG